MRYYSSPKRLLLITACAIFVAEAVVMGILAFAGPVSSLAEAFLDSAILSLFVLPILYFFLFRPMVSHIEERRRVEVDLRKERDRAQKYLDVAGVMLLVLDTRGRIRLINKRGCELLGYSEEELVGMDWFECCLPPEEGREVRGVFDRIISGEDDGGNLMYENTVLARSGERRVMLWNNKVLREEGRIVGTLSSGEDITERKEAEEALRKSEARYRLIHDSAFDALVMADSSDRVVEANPSAEKMFGYGEGEMTGMAIESLMPEHYRERHWEGLRKFLETGRSRIQGRVLELEGLSGDGETFPIELVLSSFEIGPETYFTGTIRDITERKRAEEEKQKIQSQLNQVQKMEAIGTLAGGVAHDFNNMLTAIRGNAELAMEDSDPETMAFDRLREVILSVNTASKLTRQLLLFSRGQPFRRLPMDLNRAIENILPILDRLLGKGIEIKTEFASDLWTVKADESNIEQVIMNLTVNARDVMPEGGVIIIRTENTEFDEREAKGIPGAEPGKAVCFSVTDTGPGVSREVMHRLFEPFFSTKEPGKGTGLGLAVVYGIVKQHRGWITVDSVPGRGTTFSVCIPATPEEIADEVGEPEAAGSSGRGQKVLLVESDKGVRAVTARALMEKGYHVVEASSPDTAVREFDSEGGNFHAFVSDAMLDGRSGLDLADRLRWRNPSMGVVLTASHLTDRSNWAAFDERDYIFLSKPYSLTELLRAVSTALEKRGRKT